MTIYALGGDAPQIHDDTWVAPDANLIGKVVMEAGSSVWFGCTCAPTTRRSASAKARTCRRIA